MIEKLKNRNSRLFKTTLFFSAVILCSSVCFVHASTLLPGGVITGICFEDSNENGIFDPDEMAIPGVEIIAGRMLAGMFLVSVRSTVTDEDGVYLFENSRPGFYRIQGLPPEGYDETLSSSMTVFLGYLSDYKELDFAFRLSQDQQYPVVTVSIEAYPSEISNGDSVTLSWKSEYADMVFINNGIGEVDTEGSLRVCPSETVLYTITAEGPGGEAAGSVQINVEESQPPPEPTGDNGSSQITTPSTSTSISGEFTTTTTSVHSSTTTTIGNNSQSTTSTIARGPAPSSATGLVAAPSDCKVGLAWKNPDDELWKATMLVRKTGGYPSRPYDGVAVYDGTDSDFVDTELESGVKYYYRVFSYSAGPVFSLPLESARTFAVPHAINEGDWLSDWHNSPDPFADAVVDFQPAVNSGLTPYGDSKLPDIVLGPPHGGGQNGNSVDILSLGSRVNNDGGNSSPYGGSIILKFTDNIIVNGAGPDFTVFENAFERFDRPGVFFMEPAVVSVSQDGIIFHQFPCDFIPMETDENILIHCSDPENYISGFAGISPVLSLYDSEMGSINFDPTDPLVSGGDSFDLDDLEGVPFGWVQYVKIQSTGDNWLPDCDGDLIRHTPETGASSGADFSGFDLDAVSAINY